MSAPPDGYKPKDMSHVTMVISFDDCCAKAIELYKKLFGAELAMPPMMAADKISHAVIKIGESQIMLNDAFMDFQVTSPSTAYVYVEDVDNVCKMAEAEGCDIVLPPEDQFWGDRMARVKDPFGNFWMLATCTSVPSKEDMETGSKKMEEDYIKSKKLKTTDT